MGVRGQRHAPAALPTERSGTHCIGGCVGPKASLDGCGRSRPFGIRSPDRPAISESLYRMRYGNIVVADFGVATDADVSSNSGRNAGHVYTILHREPIQGMLQDTYFEPIWQYGVTLVSYKAI